MEKTVLYVCVHNSGRSQMAEKFTSALSGGKVKSVSAGTVAGEKINPMAEQAMAEIGLSMAGQKPKQLTQEMVDAADQVITMGCGVDAEACPARFILTDDWGLDDPAGQPIEKVREIRDQIKDRVEKLLAELETPTSGE